MSKIDETVVLLTTAVYQLMRANISREEAIKLWKGYSKRKGEEWSDFPSDNKELWKNIDLKDLRG